MRCEQLGHLRCLYERASENAAPGFFSHGRKGPRSSAKARFSLMRASTFFDDMRHQAYAINASDRTLKNMVFRKKLATTTSNAHTIMNVVSSSAPFLP
jgi:hypothetical protein